MVIPSFLSQSEEGGEGRKQGRRKVTCQREKTAQCQRRKEVEKRGRENQNTEKDDQECLLCLEWVVLWEEVGRQAMVLDSLLGFK